MTAEDSVDETVETFVELEDELGSVAADEYDAGTVAAAAKVRTADVPDDYPARFDTEHALRLDVAVGEGATVATYLEWPASDQDEGDVLALLDALGHSRDEFADLYGDEVALDARDGWHVIDLQGTAALAAAGHASDADSLDATRNLLAVAVGAAIAGYSLQGALYDIGAGLVGLTWLAIPVLLYVDANRIEDATGWSPETRRWVAGAVIPGVNVPVTAAYLLDRHVRLRGVTAGDAPRTWFWAIVGSLALSVASFALYDPTSENVFVVMLFGFGWLFLPFAVYFDAEYVGHATDWDPNEGLWAAVAFLAWIVGTGAYLYKRSTALD